MTGQHDHEDSSAKPQAWVEGITFSDGTPLEFGQSDIVVFVGPNNSGKSASLRGIEDKLAHPQAESPAVASVSLKTEGDFPSVVSWLTEFCHVDFRRDPSNPLFNYLGAVFVQGSAEHGWKHWERHGLHDFCRFLCRRLTTEERLSASNPPASVNLLSDPKTHPVHRLQVDDALAERLSELFSRAFGEELILNYGAGSVVPLHTGKEPRISPGQDRVSRAYLDQLRQLPLLHNQGDGMRSFVGVLLNCLAVASPIVLIDEPEAFLHPPQAHLLGRMLVSETPPDRQLFLATHSGDLLRGLVEEDSDGDRVRVVRVTRDGALNPITQLSPRDLRTLWADPLLRHSNILDGLFHGRVVVCESDSDCRFYQAVSRALVVEPGAPRPPDCLFVHCGGKGRMPVVVQALEKVGVDVRAVLDFDLLNDRRLLKELVESAGGSWERLEPVWRQVKHAIESKKPGLPVADVQEQIAQALDQNGETYLSRETKQRIERILRQGSPWSVVKMAGMRAVPNGQPTVACSQLISDLGRLGIHVVEVGELESFVQSVGSHGPTWVNKVLEGKNLGEDHELGPAREFVRTFTR